MTRHLKAIYEGGVFRPLEPAQLAEHQEVTLLLETPDETRPRAGADRPIWEFAAGLVRDIPQDALNVLPTDGAAQHDRTLGPLASGGRKSAVSAPADIADALPQSGKQGADAPRSPNDRDAPAGREAGSFHFRKSP